MYVLRTQVAGYVNRLAVLPGVTGLLQINLPPDATVANVRRKVAMDQEYIRQAGFFPGSAVILSTFVRMVGLPRGAGHAFVRTTSSAADRQRQRVDRPHQARRSRRGRMRCCRPARAAGQAALVPMMARTVTSAKTSMIGPNSNVPLNAFTVTWKSITKCPPSRSTSPASNGTIMRAGW